MLCEQINHIPGLGIACTEAASEPITATMNECFIIGAHVELPGCAGREHDIDMEALLDEGRETRSLGFIVLSGGAVVNLDLH